MCRRRYTTATPEYSVRHRFRASSLGVNSHTWRHFGHHFVSTHTSPIALPYNLDGSLCLVKFPLTERGDRREGWAGGRSCLAGTTSLHAFITADPSSLFHHARSERLCELLTNMSSSPPPYLLPLSNTVDLPPKYQDALRDVEQQFDLPTDKLQEIVKQMLWEFETGLREEPTAETVDTFM